MNKVELIDAIAKKALLKKTDAKTFLNAFVDVASTSLVSDNKVAISGFGIFSVTERKTRMSRNPATGASIEVPAKKVVKFRPSSVLRNKVKK
jgi:DNA-binding protein HU-beta